MLCTSGFTDDVMARNRRCNSDSVGSNIDLSPWCIPKLTHQGQHRCTGPGAESDVYDCLVIGL